MAYHHRHKEYSPQRHREHRDEIIIFNIVKRAQGYYKEYIGLYLKRCFIFRNILKNFYWSLKTFVNFVSLW